MDITEKIILLLCGGEKNLKKKISKKPLPTGKSTKEKNNGNHKL